MQLDENESNISSWNKRQDSLENMAELPSPFDNAREKNNILRIGASGNVVWTIDNSGYINNSYPFEQMTLRDGWLYASDCYARRLKVDIKTGKIVNMAISK